MPLARRLVVTALVAGLASAGLAAPQQSSDGQNRRVRVHNQTGLAMNSLRAADVRTGEYGDNLLAGSPLDAGANRPILIDDGRGGCLYDLQAQLSSGQTVTKENVNVCRIADVYLTR